MFLNSGADYGQISEETWQYLLSIYGGGPEIAVRQTVAPTDPDSLHGERKIEAETRALWDKERLESLLSEKHCSVLLYFSVTVIPDKNFHFLAYTNTCIQSCLSILWGNVLKISWKLWSWSLNLVLEHTLMSAAWTHKFLLASGEEYIQTSKIFMLPRIMKETLWLINSYKPSLGYLSLGLPVRVHLFSTCFSTFTVPRSPDSPFQSCPHMKLRILHLGEEASLWALCKCSNVLLWSCVAREWNGT